MATRRSLALAVTLALAPAMAAAQVDRPTTWEGQTPTIRAPGAVPPPRTVVPPKDPATGAEKVGTAAGLAGAGATLLTEGALNLGRKAEAMEVVAEAGNVANHSQSLGKVAGAVSLGANVMVMGEKCGDPKASTLDCVQASLNVASSEASVIEMVKPVGSMAQGLSIAADATGAYNKCFADAEATKLDCVAGLSDTFISATSNVPGGGKVVAATYSIAKTVLPAAVDSGGTWLLGQSPGAWFYDKFYAAEDNARIDAESRSAALKDKQRAARRQAYQQSAGALASKQADEDARQARLAAERRAAENQAYANSQSAAQAQALASSIAAVVQARMAPPATAVSAPSSSRSSASEDPCANSPDPYCSRR